MAVLAQILILGRLCHMLNNKVQLKKFGRLNLSASKLAYLSVKKKCSSVM